MSFDSVMNERNRQEIEAGQRRADGARARMADQDAARANAALLERARTLDVGSYVNEMDTRARIQWVDPMRLTGDKIDVSQLILRVDDRMLISVNRDKIIQILQARAARELL